MSSTVNALMQRGINSDLAKQLSLQGYTLGKLKLTSKEDLLKLNIPESIIDAIFKEARPPIPEETLRKLLYDSRYTCCICRDNSKSIIVHHIVPWEDSRSHDESNLVVLCLEHHGEAHTKHDLSINLTPNKLIDSKSRWLQTVIEKDIETVLIISRSEGGYFDYFNIFRIFELADNLNIELNRVKYYTNALSYGFINNQGLPLPINSWSKKGIEDKDYWIDFFDGGHFYLYLKNLFMTITNNRNFILLNKIWNRKDIVSILKPGDFIFLQGAFYFKSLTKNTKGQKQNKLGYRKAKGIRLEFEIDAFYCNSDSSRFHLSGRNVKTAYCIIRSISFEMGQLIIKCSALAIGTGFNRLDFIFSFDEEQTIELEDFSGIIQR